MKTSSKKSPTRESLKQQLTNQKQRLVASLADMHAILEQIEEKEKGWHSIQLAVWRTRNALDAFIYPEHHLLEGYLDCSQWLRVWAPAIENGYVAEADLKREALALARPNGPHKDDGVVEILKGDRVVVLFAKQILHIAFPRCPVIPFPQAVEFPAELSKSPAETAGNRKQGARSKRKSANVLDMQSFRDDKRARRRF